MRDNPLVSPPCITRFSGNPVLTGRMVPYPSDLVFNAGVIPWKNGYAMVFRNDFGYLGRASFSGTNIGLALSEDGLRWQVEDQPVFSMKDEEVQRVYDPRLTVIEGKAYMTFAMDTRHGLRGGIAVSEDLRHFEVLSLTVPDNRNMVLFPEKIGGMFMRLERPMPVYSRGKKDRFDIWLSESPDLVYWGRSRLVLGVEDFPFANDKIGPGAPPIRTREGWLAVLHTVDIDPGRGKNGWEDRWIKRYCAAVALLDAEEPWKVIGCGKTPLLVPETDYEIRDGFRTNVVFPTGAVQLNGGIIRIYYGAADTVVAVAEAKEEDLIALCKAGR
ncbi:MAG: glycoside hydrolase family 130 protein [Clostridia bacterium]|nr:glycoside hydrolase family 130 protein [Clostridia bacterium]